MTRAGSSAGKRASALPQLISGQEIILVVIIVALWLLLALANPSFLDPFSIQSMLWRLAPTGIMAIGMTLVIITGGIDISVAAILMVCAASIARLTAEAGWGFWPAVAFSLVLGAVLGGVNGLLISYGRVPAMLVTFGTANLFKFVGYRIFDSNIITGLPPSRSILGPGAEGQVFGIPIAFLIMVVVLCCAWYYLRHFPGGRHFYAIGDDSRAATLAGVNTRWRVFIVYVVMGTLVGLAAAITIGGGTANLDQTVGKGQELLAIAAAVIGGTSILGGRGSVLGSVLGALLVQTVASGVTQLRLPSQLSDLFVGVFIIIAVGADIIRQRRREARL